MLQHLREALIDKIDEKREGGAYCVVQWSDTKKVEIILQDSIRLPVAEVIRLNATYTIYIDGFRRHGTVLDTGTKNHCEMALYQLSSHAGKTPDAHVVSGLLDDMILMKILNKLINNKNKRADDESGEDTHDVQCAACDMKPIARTDRYRCLECSSSFGYDLCGACFEKRRHTGQHRTGHAMIHFKIPNEFLGISIGNITEQLNLNQLKRFYSLQNEQHDGITCDGECKRKNFVGLRFKCDTCPHYNLCQQCAIEKRVTTKMHQNDHPIILTSNRVMPNIEPDDIELGDVLGRGAFGYVCKATWISKNRHVACKIIEVSGESKTSNQLKESFLLELAAYRELSGPYILRTFGYSTHRLSSNHIRGATTQFMILMELMNRGSLQNVLDNQSNQLSLRRKLTMSRQIASGMRRIHQHGMIHRDIRPDNILVTENYIAKIGDMGIARVLDPQGQQTQIGCIQFMPPEFFLHSSDGHVKCDEKLDIYTYGLTLNQLFTEVMHDFRFSSPSPQITLTKQSPVFYDEIILPCLESDSRRRPTAIEIERVLEMYEQAFGETMLTDSYINMSTKEKDRNFIEFYHKNRSQIQRFLKEQLSSHSMIEIPVQIPRAKRQQSLMAASNHDPVDNTCRIN